MNSFGHGGRTPRRSPCRKRWARSAASALSALLENSHHARPGSGLNATFEPINVTAVRRAMVLMIKGVAQAEEIHHTQVHSASRALPVPSVIRLLPIAISRSRLEPITEEHPAARP